VRLSLSKHVPHNSLRSGSPYYILTMLHWQGSSYPLSEDALSSSVDSSPGNLHHSVARSNIICSCQYHHLVPSIPNKRFMQLWTSYAVRHVQSLFPSGQNRTTCISTILKLYYCQSWNSIRLATQDSNWGVKQNKNGKQNINLITNLKSTDISCL
jgi:hypothetical protein